MRIRTERMSASSNLVAQIDKYIKPKSKDITVFDGCVTEMIGTNITTINPIKIVVNTQKFIYVILHYGSYSKDENDIFLYTPCNKISWLKLIEILKTAKN